MTLKNAPKQAVFDDRGAAAVADAVETAWIAISTAPNSTAAMAAVLLRADAAFVVAGFGTLVGRLDGTGLRPGDKPIDDAEPLRRIIELLPVLGSTAVGAIANTMYPGDDAAQDAASHRWRRKLKAKGITLQDFRTR